LASRNGVNIRLERCPLRSHLLYAGRKFS
jgi:hypothetical protein